MKPRIDSNANQPDLFKIELTQIINMSHDIVKLANSLNWDSMCAQINSLFSSNKGRPAKNTRLMLGLEILKSLNGMTDEETLSQWLQNPYWQYFCGGRFFEHKIKTAPSTMSSWRKRFEKTGLLEKIDEFAKSGTAVRNKKRITIF